MGANATIQYFSAGIFRDNLSLSTISNFSSIVTVSNNNSIVAAVAGKIIRVISLVVSAQAAGTSFLSFKSNSGGTVCFHVSAPSTALQSLPFIFNPAGWFETEVGKGLFLDVTTQPCDISGRYIVFTP